VRRIAARSLLRRAPSAASHWVGSFFFVVMFSIKVLQAGEKKSAIDQKKKWWWKRKVGRLGLGVISRTLAHQPGDLGLSRADSGRRLGVAQQETSRAMQLLLSWKRTSTEITKTVKVAVVGKGLPAVGLLISEHRRWRVSPLTDMRTSLMAELEVGDS